MDCARQGYLIQTIHLFSSLLSTTQVLPARDIRVKLMAEPEPRRILHNSQGLQQHALNCSDSACIIPMCVNKKLLQLKHSQGFQTVNACKVSQTLKTLTIEPAGSCIEPNCLIPFRMGANDNPYKGAQTDLNDHLGDVIKDNFPLEFSFEQRDSSEISRPQGVRSKVTQRLAKSTLAPPPYLKNAKDAMKVNPTVQPLNVLINHSSSVQTTSSPAHLAPQSCLVQRKDQSSVNAANGMTGLTRRALMELFPVSSAGTLTTPPIATGSSPYSQDTTINAWAKASAPNNSVGNDVPSPFTLGQGQNAALLQTSQIDNAVQRQRIHSETSPPFPQEPGTSGNTPQERNFNVDDGADNDTGNTRTQMKARLMYALYSIQRLLMQTKSTEEQQMCIRLLTAVLHETKVFLGTQV